MVNKKKNDFSQRNGTVKSGKTRKNEEEEWRRGKEKKMKVTKITIAGNEEN